MRIALVNHRDWIEGGMDKVALVQLETLQRLGHTVELFTQFHANNRKTPYRKYFPQDVERQRYLLRLKKLHTFPKDLYHTFYNPVAGQQFAAFLDDFKPDIVHVHGLMRAFSPALYDAAASRDIPVIQTHHYVKLICPTGKLLQGDHHYCQNMPCIRGNTVNCVLHACQDQSIFRSLVSAFELKVNRRRYIEKPSLHLAPSRYLENLLLRAGVESNKLCYHPNFVNTDIFFPDNLSSTREDYFFYMGRLANEKGIQVLIDAFAPLTSCKLYIAGTGPLEAYCQRRIQQEKLYHIQCLGHLNENALVPWIQHARATLMPSLWGEIFGLTIIESFACATPVIGARVGAIPELIEEGHNGFLVEPGNVKALQNAIFKMALISKKTIDGMGYAGLEQVRQRYTLNHHIENLIRFYEREAVAV